MFEHKRSVGIARLTNPLGADRSLSIGSSSRSKDTMDPSKDSWVFTKDVPQKYHTSKRHKHALDNISYSIREESLSPSLTDEEVMKLNALYSGSVYRVKGFRIICSVLTGIVLLLTALVILGIWIILGANENGEMYFPWNEIENSTINSVKNEKTKLGGFLLDIDYDALPPEGHEVQYDLPSHEVAEAIGHFQGVNPKPSNRYDAVMTSVEYDQYNMDYEEYYNDLLEEYSLLHPTVVEPPPGFVEDLYEYYDEDVDYMEEMVPGASNIVTVSGEAPLKTTLKQISFTSEDKVNDVSIATESTRSANKQTVTDTKKPNPTSVQNLAEPTSESPNTEQDVVEYDGVLIDDDFQNPMAISENRDNLKQMAHTEVIELTLTEEDLEEAKSKVAPLFNKKEEKDPHWDLFTKKYTSDEVILDHLLRNRFNRRNLRVSGARKENINEHHQMETSGKRSRSYSPIPHVRRSQIASGAVRPRLNSAQLEYLKQKREQSMHPTVVSENLPRFGIDRRDGPPIQNFRESPLARSPIRPNLNNFQPWRRRSTFSRPLRNPINTLQRQSANQRVPAAHFRSPHGRSPAVFQRKSSQSEVPETGFIKALTNMYDYSKNIATALMKLPDKNDVTTTRTSIEFLKNSFGLLYDYDHVFSNLPQVFMEPLIKFKLPSSDQLDDLNPFQISLITWTFIDFWEFLIEKVGTLSREDLRTLELRLAKIRQTKDSRIARALIDAEANNTAQLDGADRLREIGRSLNIETFKNSSQETGSDVDIKHNLVEEDQTKFMKYSIKTLLNFGRVYLETDYALDCMMLLFCRDMNANTEREGMEGVAAKLKSVGLKVLVDREGRERDTISSVWQALFEWQPLQCEAMFPKCDASRALEIVNEVASAAR